MTIYNHDLVNRILAVLRERPDGATAKEIGEAIAWPACSTSGRLGKLAMYGHLDRELLPPKSRKHSPGKEYLYRIKQQGVG